MSLASTTHAGLERVRADFAGISHELPDAVSSRATRHAVLERLASTGLPTNRDENWRYAQLRGLEKLRLAPAPAATDLAMVSTGLPAAAPGLPRIVLVNGRFVRELSGPDATQGVVVEAGRAIADGAPVSGDLRFAALNAALAVDAVTITARGKTPRALEIICVSTAAGIDGACYPTLAVRIETGATLTLVERHVSLPGVPAFAHASVDVAVGRDARLVHLRVQAVGEAATQFDTVTARVERAANYDLTLVAVGAAASRTTLDARLAGEGATVGLRGATAVHGAQVSDTYARIEHAAAATETRQTFRGIAGGRARIGFNGHIVMRPGAARAASQQSLRTLITGAAAEANLRPQLEIYTDDVRANHGATAGRLDEQMLFYLLSRGIDRSTAESLLQWAFVAEIAAPLADATLRLAARQALASRLGEPGAGEPSRVA
jgi:Fe-S cluster assembly protein SufD